MSSTVVITAALVVLGGGFFQNGKILVVLQNEACGLTHGIRGQFLDAQSIQCGSPIQSFRNGGLFQYGFAGPELLDSQSNLNTQLIIHMGSFLRRIASSLSMSGNWMYR